MSRSWNTWITRWKVALAPTRRSVRRRVPLRVRLATESLELRVNPGVVFGMGIGSPPKPPPADTTSPTLTVSPLTGSPFTSDPTITGTATDDAAGVRLFASTDGDGGHQVDLNSDGTFSFTPGLATDGSADGPHTVQLAAVDTSGHVSYAAPISFRLAASPPTVNVDDLGGTSFSDNQTITGTVSDNNPFGRTLTVSVDGGPVASVLVSTVGEFSYTTQLRTDGSQDGQHTFTFVAHDSSGNASDPKVVTFTLSTSSKGLTLQLDSASSDLGGNKTTKATVNLTGTGPASTTITLTQTGATTQSDANGKFTFSNVSVATGSNTFTVTAAGGLHASTTVIRDNAPTVASPVTDFAVSQGVAKSVFNLPTIFSDADVNTLIQFVTNRGTFDVELFNQQVGATVANFIKYVTGTDAAGSSYSNTIFHRETRAQTDGISVLQGGGFFLGTANGGNTINVLGTDAQIALQAGLTNELGTLAMARTGEPNSATSQFFFNMANDAVLDVGGGADPNGYAVFGVVRGSLSVLNASFAVPPVNQGGVFSAIPVTGHAANDPGFWSRDPNFGVPGPNEVTSTPTNATPDQFERVLGAAVIRSPNASLADALSFSVTGNTNPGLVQASINNGLLTLKYAAGVSGGATITLTATDASGAKVSTSFSVSVGNDTTAPTVNITSPTSDITTKTNPTITGTAVDNTVVSKLVASVDGGAAQAVTVGANGSFSFTPNLPVNGSADGAHSVVFTATDPSNNSSTPVTVNFHLDTTLPIVNITFPTTNQTFHQTPTITGTATDNQTLSGLTASVDGGAAQAVNVNAQHQFGFTPSGLTDGSHTVTFVATDAAGNQSVVASVTFTLSATTPAVTITSPDDGQAFKTNPQFTGNVADQTEASTLTASVDNGSPVPVTVDAQGHFTFTPSVTTEGTHTVTFAAGTGFSPVSRTYVLDKTAPVVTITGPTNGQTFNHDPSITGTIADTLSGVAGATASVDGQTPQVLTVDAQGHFTFIPPIASGGVADGPHTVTIVATDKAGNASVGVDVTFTLDTKAPAINVTSPQNGDDVTADPTFIGTVTDNQHLVAFGVSVDGGASQPITFDAQTGSFSFDPHLAVDGSADGQHTFVFTATDSANNIQTLSMYILLDTQPPTVTITSPSDGQTFKTNITVNGKADDAVGSGFVNVFVDGVFVEGFGIPTNGPFSYTTTLALDGSANGPHTVSFVSTDAAGHQSSPATLHFTLAATPNAVILTAPPDGAAVKTNPDFVGKVFDQSEASSLTASVDGGAPVAVTVDAQGGFTFTPSLPTDGSADGTHTVTFAAAGDFNSVSRSFVLDTKAPTAVITAPPDGAVVAAPPLVSGSVSDVGTGVASVHAVLDNGVPFDVVVNAQDGSYSFQVPLATNGSADGPHTISVTVTDKAGNDSAPALVHFTLDTTAPNVLVSSPPDGSSLNQSPTFIGTVADNLQVKTLTASVDGGAAVQVTFDAQTGSFSFNPNLATDGSADGAHTYVFTATDGAGNVSTVTRVVYLDTTKPTVVINSPADGLTFNTNPTIDAKANDNIGSGFVYVYVDGVLVDGLSISTNADFSYTTKFKLDGSDNGDHTVSFVATDAAGNASDPVTFHFTLQAP
jgi:cyclophilin family peptidyl-prolyl cis-trans isomerase